MPGHAGVVSVRPRPHRFAAALFGTVAAFASLALVAGCTSGSQAGAGPSTVVTTVTAAPKSASASHTTPKPSPTTPGPKRGSGAPVHVKLYENDGQRFGVGMPIVAYFSAMVTDATSFDLAAKVTVNGVPVHGAWYWERSNILPGYPLEAHYRLPTYWRADSVINVDLPLAGVSAGPGLVFDDNLTLHMLTGDAQVVKIDGQPGVDKMWVYDNGRLIRTFDISLGAADTPTYAGTAVVIGKANPQDMVSAPGEPYYNLEVPWSVRVTYDGEFLHDAYWNGELGQANLSHGCTNMAPADAQWYYNWSQIGDPVTWTNTGTSQTVPVWDGYGDWNLSWAAYKQGGLLSPPSVS